MGVNDADDMDPGRQARPPKTEELDIDAFDLARSSDPFAFGPICFLCALWSLGAGASAWCRPGLAAKCPWQIDSCVLVSLPAAAGAAAKCLWQWALWSVGAGVVLPTNTLSTLWGLCWRNFRVTTVCAGGTCWQNFIVTMCWCFCGHAVCFSSGTGPNGPKGTRQLYELFNRCDKVRDKDILISISCFYVAGDFGISKVIEGTTAAAGTVVACFLIEASKNVTGCAWWLFIMGLKAHDVHT